MCCLQITTRTISNSPACDAVFVRKISRFVIRFIPDAENTRDLIAHCGDKMYQLTICLRQESSFGLKFQECDDLLVQTLVCLSTKPDVPFMRAQPDVAEAIVEEHPEMIDGLVSKRGLGRCIHKCLQGQGGMNFIQCKSLCHR